MQISCVQSNAARCTPASVCDLYGRLGVLQIMEAVGMKKAGPQLGRLTSALLAWQLGRPQATADEARAWLQQQQLQQPVDS
jgi:hypothetical protein